MTDKAPASNVAFGQILGQAQKKSDSLLVFLLDQADLTFDGWVCLRRLAARGPDTVKTDFVENIAEGLGVEASKVDQLIHQLASREILELPVREGTTYLEFTETGRSFFQSLTEKAQQVGIDLLATCDASDIERAVHVLRVISDRAPSILAQLQSESS
jgi:DNA-binding MarR family transcriptional regulator